MYTARRELGKGMVSQNSSQQIEQPPAGHFLLLGRRGVYSRAKPFWCSPLNFVIGSVLDVAFVPKL